MYILQSDLLGIQGVKEGGVGGRDSEAYSGLRGGNYGGSAPPDLWIAVRSMVFRFFWPQLVLSPPRKKEKLSVPLDKFLNTPLEELQG